MAVIRRDTALIDAADRLRGAASTGLACAPVRDLLGDTDVAAAYEVQQANIALAVNAGRRRTGRKIGLTSEAVQHQLGVDRPDFGTLLDDMYVEAGGDVPAGRLLQPKVEAEVVLWLTSDLTGPLDSIDDVRPAVGQLAAAIEIVDSRIQGWDITIVDTVADNASSGLFVIGSERATLDTVEPAEVEMTLEVNGIRVSIGNGRACLGDPLSALLWLARTAVEMGDPLRAGELVLTGALGPMFAVNPGDRVEASVSGLGTVSVNFTGKER